MFDYIQDVISAYYAPQGSSPKHIFGWGMNQFFLQHIPEGAKVLDIGCGTGLLARELAKKTCCVVAYDADPDSIRWANVHSAAQNIHYYVGDALSDLPSEHFDRVVLSGILTFVDNPNMFLQALHNITCTLLIRETRYDNCFTVLLGEELGVAKSHWKEFTKSELVALLAKNGWMVVDSWDTYDIFLVAEARSL